MKTEERVFPARLKELRNVQDFVRESLEERVSSMRTMFQLEMATEEIFVNIARYAYGEKQDGDVLIRCVVGGEPCQARIQFIDGGVPFDPVAKKDADVTLPIEKRKVGGLGILMVKKSVDKMEYCYEDGKNMLTLIKMI